MKKIIIYLLIISTALLSGSCKKSLLDLKSQSAYDYNTYFNNSPALNQATIATYSTLLHQGLWSREYYFIFDLLGMDHTCIGAALCQCLNLHKHIAHAVLFLVSDEARHITATQLVVDGGVTAGSP